MSLELFCEVENGVAARWAIEDGKLWRHRWNPNKAAIFEQNQRVRQGAGTRMMDWGKQVAEIPETDLPVLRKFFGEALFNPAFDKWSRRVAREKFLKSPASDPYRVEERKRRIK